MGWAQRGFPEPPGAFFLHLVPTWIFSQWLLIRFSNTAKSTLPDTTHPMGTSKAETFFVLFCFRRCLMPSQSKYFFFFHCSMISLHWATSSPLYHQLKLYTLSYYHYSLFFSKDQSINYRAVSQQPENLQLASLQQSVQLTFCMLVGSSVTAFYAGNSSLFRFGPDRALKDNWM